METQEKELGFAFSHQQGRASVEITVLHIWVNDSFKPVRIRLITGKTESLLGLDIIKLLDIRVCFGSDRFQVDRANGG